MDGCDRPTRVMVVVSACGAAPSMGGAMALPDIGVDDRIHSACANPALWSPSNFNVSLVYAATTPSKGLLACGYTPV